MSGIKNFPRVSSGGGTVDTTARSQATAAQAKVNEISKSPAASVPAGEVTLNAGKIWRNDTAGALTVPATDNAANMAGAGFTEQTQPVLVDEVLLSITDLTGTAPAGAEFGINTVNGKEFAVVGGNWAEYSAPAAPSGIDDVLGINQDLTANRAVSTDGFSFTIQGEGNKNILTGSQAARYSQVTTSNAMAEIDAINPATGRRAHIIASSANGRVTFAPTHGLYAATTVLPEDTTDTGNVVVHMADGRFRHRSIADFAGATLFTGLTDTPANFTGHALKPVRVNAAATALEFTDPVPALLTAVRATGTADDVAGVTEKAVRDAVDALSFAGVYKGSAATVAALPAGDNGDWAILTADDGVNQAGVWVTDGTAYTLAKEIPDLIALTDAQIQDRADTSTGLIQGGKQLFDNWQVNKGVAANFNAADTDHSIAKPWDAQALDARFNPLVIVVKATNETPEIDRLSIYPDGATIGVAPAVVDGREYATAFLNAAGNGWTNLQHYIGVGGAWIPKEATADEGLDAAATWQRNTAYTAADQFSWEATQATAVDINGNAIEQGKLYNLRYKVGKTSLDAAEPTLAELALMEIVGLASNPSNGGGIGGEQISGTTGTTNTTIPFTGDVLFGWLAEVQVNISGTDYWIPMNYDDNDAVNHYRAWHTPGVGFNFGVQGTNINGRPYRITIYRNIEQPGYILDSEVVPVDNANPLAGDEEIVELDGIQVRMSFAARQMQIRAASGSIEIEGHHSLEQGSAVEGDFGTKTLTTTWQNLDVTNETFTIGGAQEWLHFRRLDTNVQYLVRSRLGPSFTNNSIIIERLDRVTVYQGSTEADVTGNVGTGGSTIQLTVPETGNYDITMEVNATQTNPSAAGMAHHKITGDTSGVVASDTRAVRAGNGFGFSFYSPKKALVAGETLTMSAQPFGSGAFNNTSCRIFIRRVS